MIKFGWQFFKLVALSLCLAFEAKALEKDLSVDEEDSQGFSTALSFGIYETPVDPDSADHVRLLVLRLSGSHPLPVPSSSFIQNPRLSASIGYSDQVDVEDNNSNIENSSVKFTGLGYLINDAWRFTLPVSSTVATNEDDNVYLGYLGSLSVTPGFTYTPPQEALKGASLSLGATISRSFYQFDVSKGGRYNPQQYFAPRLSLGYKADEWQFSASIANSTIYLADGSKLDDTYSSALGIDYKIDSKFSASVSWSQLDRTFGYDGSSTNINFGYADLTLLSLMLTYSI